MDNVMEFDLKRDFKSSVACIRLHVYFLICLSLSLSLYLNKNSSGDEIANVNFFLQHRTCRRQRLRPLNELVISSKHLRYLPTHETDC